MALKNFLEKLRQRPEEQKTIILWAAVIVCMTAIFVFWLISLNYSIRESLSKEKETSSAASQTINKIEEFKKDLPTLWQSLTAGLSSILNFGKQEIQYAPENQNGSGEVLPKEKLPIE